MGRGRAEEEVSQDANGAENVSKRPAGESRKRCEKGVVGSARTHGGIQESRDGRHPKRKGNGKGLSNRKSSGKGDAREAGTIRARLQRRPKCQKRPVSCLGGKRRKWREEIPQGNVTGAPVPD